MHRGESFYILLKTEMKSELNAHRLLMRRARGRIYLALSGEKTGPLLTSTRIISSNLQRVTLRPVSDRGGV